MTNNDFIRQGLKRLLESGLAKPNLVRGCSEDELKQVESTLQIILPAAYREFLTTFGKQAGEFLVGTDFLFPKLLELRNIAEELLKSCSNPFDLSKTAFVFASHHGYQ